MKYKKTLLIFVFFIVSLWADIIKIQRTRDTLFLKKIWKGIVAYKQKLYINPSFSFKKTVFPETLRVLAIRVEFQEDDDPLTTGNGLMDLKGFGHPGDGLYYDPPHTKTYFEMQLEGLKNYYYVNSKGKLIIEYDVFPQDEFKCYKLPHKMSFYADPSDYDRGLVYLMRDALWEADKDSAIDFSKYDAFIIFHAGSNLQTGYYFGRWHDIPSATVTEGALYYYLGDYYIEVDGGIKIGHASIVPESPRVDGLMVGLPGVLYHEFAHQLPVKRSPIPGHEYGLFDLYDVSGWSSGIGAWGLMGGGGWLGDPSGQVPAMLSAYSRYILGWEDPVEVTQDTTVYLYAITFDTLVVDTLGDTVHPTLIKVPIREGEYFLIENRQVNTKHKIEDIEDDTIEIEVEYGVPIYVIGGEYDAFLPGSGVLIWHVDEDVIEEYGPYNAINIFPSHKGVDLEEADGIQDFDKWVWGSSYEFEGSPYDPFFKGGNSSFGVHTNPSSKGYYGETGIEIEVEDTAKSIMKVTIRKGKKVKGFPKNVQDSIVGIDAVDLDKDGNKEIVAVTYHGKLYIWNAEGLNLFKTPRYLSDSVKAVFSCGDFTGDGKEEIIVSGVSGNVFILKVDSTVEEIEGSPISVEGRLYGTALLKDVDNDGKDEIFVATDKGYIYRIGKGEPTIEKYFGISWRKGVFEVAENRIGVLGEEGTLLFLDNTLTPLSGFPVVLGKGNACISVTPVTADFDGDGEKEVAVFVPEEGVYYLYLVSMDGEIKYKSNIGLNSSPTEMALVDVDADGLLEIISGEGNKLYGFNFNGSIAQGFPIEFAEYYTKKEIVELSFGGAIVEYSVPFIFNSPVITADKDGDGEEEIIVGSPDNGIYILYKNRKIDTLFARYGVISISTNDVDGDGKLELLAGDEKGYVYVWELDGKHSCWNTVLGNVKRDGYVNENFKDKRKIENLCPVLFVYPNPVKDRGAKIHALIGDAEKVKFSIMDVSGDFVVRDVEVSFIPNEENDFVINDYYPVDRFSPGLYILVFEVYGKGKKEVKLYKFGVVK